MDKRLIRKILAFARRHGLDLSAKRESLYLSDIETTEGTDPDAVSQIVDRLERTPGVWPDDLPLIVVESNHGEGYVNEGYALLDGHHRLAASEAVGYDRIPVLAVSTMAWSEINSEFDVPRVDYIQYVLAAVDPLIAENVAKGVGGAPKRRTRRGF
jgi:hypothetical protein